MIQVWDYDILIVLDELNTLVYVRPLNELQIPKLRHYEVGNFGPKIRLFSAKMSILPPLGVIEQLKRKLRLQAIAW